jgi:hypothetical protein
VLQGTPQLREHPVYILGIYNEKKNRQRRLGIGTKVRMSFFKFYFLPYYKEFEKLFPAEAADHSYNDVYQIVRKTDELFIKNGSVEENRQQKKTAEVVDNTKEIMETTPSTSKRGLTIIRQIKK